MLNEESFILFGAFRSVRGIIRVYPSRALLTAGLLFVYLSFNALIEGILMMSRNVLRMSKPMNTFIYLFDRTQESSLYRRTMTRLPGCLFTKQAK